MISFEYILLLIIGRQNAMVLNINLRVDLDSANPTQMNSNFSVNDQLDTLHFSALVGF